MTTMFFTAALAAAKWTLIGKVALSTGTCLTVMAPVVTRIREKRKERRAN